MMGMFSYHVKLEDRRVVRLLFAYTLPWMKGAKAICFIGVRFANNWDIIRESIPTHMHYNLPPIYNEGSQI